MISHEIIIKPLITEKTSIQKELNNQLTFEVDRRANRIEIKQAIESIFNVRVAAVKCLEIED
jgi:large subunit ribosomal protein L23